MKHTGVWTTPNDREIRKARPTTSEFMGELRLDFEFRDTRFYKSEAAPEAGPGNSAGPAKQRQSGFGFGHPQLMQERREPSIIVKRVATNYVRNKPRIAILDFNDSAFVFVGVEINMLAFTEQLVEYPRKCVQPLDAPNAAELLCFNLRQLVAFPGLQFRPWFAQKKNFAVLVVI